MRKFRKQKLQRLAYCLGTSRQIDDQGLFPESGYCPAEHGTLRDPHRIVTDSVCDSISHPVTDCDGRFRRYVSGSKSSSSGGKDHVHLPLICKTAQFLRKRLHPIRQKQGLFDLVPRIS